MPTSCNKIILVRLFVVVTTHAEIGITALHYSVLDVMLCSLSLFSGLFGRLAEIKEG